MRRWINLALAAAILFWQVGPAWAQVYDQSTGYQIVIPSGGGGGTPSNVNVTQYGSGAVPSLGTGIAGVAIAPTATAAAGIAGTVSASAEGTHVLKGSAGNLYDLYVTTGATAGYLMVFNATTAPVDGAVTPIECVAAPANATTSLFVGAAPPEVFSTGISVAFSSTGCFTKTASATAFFHGRTQ